jgi:hypothetical protein
MLSKRRDQFFITVTVCCKDNEVTIMNIKDSGEGGYGLFRNTMLVYESTYEG